MREADVQIKTFEMVRDRSRATVKISNDRSTGVQEFEGYPAQVIPDASRWAAARRRLKGQEGTLYNVDITIQMERVVAKCYTPEICQNGRWKRMSYTQREVSEPEPFERRVIKEEQSAEDLIRVLQTARGEVERAGREQLDAFCR